VRHWACNTCSGIAFQGEKAVTVTLHAEGGAFAAAIPQLLVFPATGTGQPATLPVTGITLTAQGTNFGVIGSLSAADVLVDYGGGGGSNGGGNLLLYSVNPAGRATEYGHDTVSSSSLHGFVIDLTANPAGSDAAFAIYTQGGAPCPSFTTHLLDTSTRTVTTPATPSGGGPGGWLVQGTWLDRSGTPYVSLVPNQSDCAAGIQAPSGQPMPAGVAPVVCKLTGGTWVQTTTGIFQASYGPGNWLAKVTGVTGQNETTPQDLTISSGAGTTPLTITNATDFAWAPS
jgi:hypothetical protein